MLDLLNLVHLFDIIYNYKSIKRYLRRIISLIFIFPTIVIIFYVSQGVPSDRQANQISLYHLVLRKGYIKQLGLHHNCKILYTANGKTYNSIDQLHRSDQADNHICSTLVHQHLLCHPFYRLITKIDQDLGISAISIISILSSFYLLCHQFYRLTTKIN